MDLSVTTCRTDKLFVVVDNFIFSRVNYELYNYDYVLKLPWKCMFSVEPLLAVAEQEFELQQNGQQRFAS